MLSARMCSAALMQRLAAHLVGVNQMEGIAGHVATGALQQEVYRRAYGLHVLISAMTRWQLLGPAGRVNQSSDANLKRQIAALQIVHMQNEE